jgi:hypothetical protein
MAANGHTFSLPLVGDVHVPPPEHLAWYAAVATLVALECIEWPVAALIVAGKALADNRHSRVLQELGEGMEQAG